MLTKTFNSSAGDGYLIGSGGPDNGGQVAWDKAHDSPSAGFDVNYTSNALRATSSESSGYYIARASIPFDTSEIPSGSVIESATIKFRCLAVSNTDNDGDDWVNIVNSTVDSIYTLSASDYSKIGDSVDDPTELSTRKDISSISINTYYTFTLNAEGLKAINPGGFTKLGLREGHDCLDNYTQSNTGNSVQFATSEHSTSAYRPLLTVTYRFVPFMGFLL